MKRACLSLVLVALIVLSAPAMGQGQGPLSPLQKRLFTLWAEDERAGAFDKLRFHLQNPPELEGLLVALDFLNKRLFEQRASHPVYFMAHAQLLWVTGDTSVMDLAALSAGTAQLLLQTDAARCAEEGAGQTLMAQAGKELAQPLAYLAQKVPAARHEAIRQILAREELVKQRPPDAWLCLDAPDAQARLLAWVHETHQKTETLDDPSAPGRKVTFYPSPPPGLLAFTGDAAWQDKRQEIRAAFARAYGETAGPPAR